MESFADTVIDRAAGAFEQFRQRAVQEQKDALPREYAEASFQCTGCKKTYEIAQMEQVHPSNGWGTCRRCYGFMFQAGVEKVRQLAKAAAKGATKTATGQQESSGFRAPPPPSGPPPWEVLGVSRDASVDEIKKAYRKLAMVYHPDRVGPQAADGEKERAREMFLLVQRAYDVMMKVRQAPST